MFVRSFVFLNVNMGRTSNAKERILSSAFTVMREKGYNNASVEEIMESAHVGKGSFYHFFPSKENLGEAVLEQYTAKLESKIINDAFDKSISPLERPIKLIELIARELETEQPISGFLTGTIASESNAIPESLRNLTTHKFETVRIEFEKTFNEAIMELRLMPNAPSKEIAGACLAFIHGLFLMCKAYQSVEPFKRYGALISRFWDPYKAS